MNFYFAIKSKKYKCKLSIPKFNNFGKIDNDIKLFEAKIKENKWSIEFSTKNEKGNFFMLDDEYLDNHKIFFLAREDDLDIYHIRNKSFSCQELLNFSNYTETEPDYRSNLKIYDENSSSSYQSDYPSKIIKSKGGILSPIYPLTNIDADTNKIFFRNIYYLPIIKEFSGYIVDIKKKLITQKIKLFSNITNEIELNRNDIHKNSYFFTIGYSGIPIFVSQKNDSISMEHTHPPHHYLYDKNKFEIIKNLKKKFYEILDKKNI